MTPNAYTSEAGVWLPPAKTSGATHRGLVAAMEDATEDASITLERLKSATCMHRHHLQTSEDIRNAISDLRTCFIRNDHVAAAYSPWLDIGKVGLCWLCKYITPSESCNITVGPNKVKLAS